MGGGQAYCQGGGAYLERGNPGPERRVAPARLGVPGRVECVQLQLP